MSSSPLQQRSPDPLASYFFLAHDDREAALTVRWTRGPEVPLHKYLRVKAGRPGFASVQVGRDMPSVSLQLIEADALGLDLDRVVARTANEELRVAASPYLYGTFVDRVPQPVQAWLAQATPAELQHRSALVAEIRSEAQPLLLSDLAAVAALARQGLQTGQRLYAWSRNTMLAPNEPAPIPAGEATPSPPAGWWRQITAQAIDAAAAMAFWVILAVPVLKAHHFDSQVADPFGPTARAWLLVAILPSVLLIERHGGTRTGQTYGRGLMHIQLVRTAGGQPALRQTCTRTCLALTPPLLWGFSAAELLPAGVGTVALVLLALDLLLLALPHHRAGHDLLARTMVVRGRRLGIRDL